MEKLMLLLAGAIPEEMLIEELEKAITQYKLTKDLETMGDACSLIIARLTINLTEGGVD